VNCKVDAADDDVDVGKAKHTAKCVVTALTDAGFEIVLKYSKPNS
jgi:hypothetical protein